MLEPLANLIRRWRADPRPAPTLALCQALAEAGELHRVAPPVEWAEYVHICAEVGRVVADRFALDLDVLLAAGRMHLAAGATWDAQSATLQAAKIAPDEPRGWVLLGEALLRRGDAQRAARSLERAAEAGVRIDPDVYELACTLATHTASRDSLAELVARRLGYGVLPPPPGMASIAPGSTSTPPPSMGVPRAPRVPSMSASRRPAAQPGRGSVAGGAPTAPDVPHARAQLDREEPGEMTVRHEFDRNELMALLRAADELGAAGVASAADPRAKAALSRFTPSIGEPDPTEEERVTRQRPAPVRPPVHSDAFTLIRRPVEDDTTTESHEAPTAIGRVPQELLDEYRRAAGIDVPRVASMSQSFDEVVPTLARQLAPRSPHLEHHPMPEDETTAERPMHGVDDEDTSDVGGFDDLLGLASSDAFGQEEGGRDIVPLPVARQPQPMPDARVIVEAQRRPHLAPTPPALPRAMPVPSSPPPRDLPVMSALVDDDHSAPQVAPVTPSASDPLATAAEHPTTRRRRPSRRRLVGWLLGGAVLATLGGVGAQAYRQHRAAGAEEEARAALARSRAALDAGDHRGAKQAADVAVELAPRDPAAIRAAIDARVVEVLDGGVTSDAAVDVVTTARRLGAQGSALATAALAAAVGARNPAHAQELLDQHRRDEVARDDAVYLLAEGAAFDLLAEPAAIDAYARARELAPGLGSARVRHVRALVFAGRIGEARDAAGGGNLPRPVANAIDVLLARAERPERWPEKDVRILRDDVGDLPRPLRAIGAALALVPPDAQGGSSMGLDAAIDDADTPGALLLCGQLALAASDLDGALGAAQRATQMRPGWTPAHALAARVLLLRGRLDEALALEASLPPTVAAELRAIAAYESGDPESLAEAESRAVEKGAARWPALALALGRLRSGDKRPGPGEADGLLAEDAVWADVLAVDLAVDAGDLARAETVSKKWSVTPDPARALRLARLRRVKGDLDGAAAMIEVAGAQRWARVEGVLLAAETRDRRKKAIAALEAGTADPAVRQLTPFLLAYLRGREGAFQAAKSALGKTKVPKGGPLEARVVALLGLAGARDTAQSGALHDLVGALRGRPEVVWAGVMLGVLPPTRMPKGMK